MSPNSLAYEVNNIISDKRWPVPESLHLLVRKLLLSRKNEAMHHPESWVYGFEEKKIREAIRVYCALPCGNAVISEA